jgi:hypothetical protein
MADTRSRENVSKLNDGSMKAVDELFRAAAKGDLPLDAQVLAKLHKSLGEEKFVNAAYDYYKKRLEQIREKALKFKNALFRKYSSLNLDTRMMIEKAKKYAKKYDLSESEFNIFVKFLMTDKAQSMYNMYNIPATPMSKTLGYASVAAGDKLNVSDAELPELKQIMDEWNSTKELHRKLVLQTLLYTDMQAMALVGEFNQHWDKQFKYVHPVLAALFLPKIKCLDERILLSSIADIIAAKYESRPIMTQYDYETYWDLITDPNQTACVVDNTKTVTDLKNRVMLQTQIWTDVMNLRTGKYYADTPDKFISKIDTCNNNLFDAPDLAYSRDEGTIIRRLFNAFSLRPTTIQTSHFTGMPQGVSGLSYTPLAYNQVTTIPMVTFRLPSPQFGALPNLSLQDALTQPQWFVEGKTLVPKIIEIIDSSGIIVFHVDRRFKSVNRVNKVRPFVFEGLPPTLSSLETLNIVPIDVADYVPIADKTFTLRSAICVDVHDIGELKNLITGTFSLIYDENRYAYCYLPQEAGKPLDPNDAASLKYTPIMGASAAQVSKFIRTQATVYIYVKA